MLGFIRRLMRGQKSNQKSDNNSTEFTVAELGMRFSHRVELATVYLVSRPEPLFSVVGVRSLALPHIVRTERLQRPAITLDFGPPLNITCVQMGLCPPGEAKVLQKARQKLLPDGRQALEFVLYSGNEQVVYFAEIGLDYELQDFIEYTPVELLFSSVPPVSQMVAFLRATLHQRRTPVRSLQGMARRCKNARVKAVADYLCTRLHAAHDFAQPGLVELSSSLQAQGIDAHPSTLVALCLLADIFLGRIDNDSVDACVDDDRPLIISDEALSAAAKFFGGHSPRAALAQADLAWGYLREAVSNRNVRSILLDLAEDGGNPNSKRVVEHLLHCLPSDASMSNDEQVALGQYMDAHGKSVNRDTIAAVCLYVDCEAGIITEEGISNLEPNSFFTDHSLYSLMSVARSFDVPLRCLCLVGDTNELWQNLEWCLSLARSGFIARFIDSGKSGCQTWHITDLLELQRIKSSNLYFTSEVLIDLPVVEYLDVGNLETFLLVGKPVLACFVSEDRAVRWRVVKPGAAANHLPEQVVGRHGFIEGFRAYSFGGKAVGKLSRKTSQELCGTTKQIVVYVNNRGSRTYRYMPNIASEQEVLQAPGEELEFAGEVLELADLTGLTVDLVEPTHEHFLGIPDDTSAEHSRLGLCLKGLRIRLCAGYKLAPFSGNEQAVSQLQKAIEEPFVRGCLANLLEPKLRCAIVLMIGRQRQRMNVEFQVSPSLFAALNEPDTASAAALVIIHTMCSQLPEEIVNKPGFRWHQREFADVVQEAIFAAMRHTKLNVQIAACGLLSSSVVSENRSRREASLYLLSRMLEDTSLSYVACASLAMLSLIPTVKAEPLVAKINWNQLRMAVDIASAEEREVVGDIVLWMERCGRSAQEVAATANLRGENLKQSALATLISRFNNCAREEGSIAQQRSYFVLPFGTDVVMRKRLRATWRAYCDAKSLDMQQLSDDQLDSLLTPEFYSDFISFVPSYETSNSCQVMVRDAKLHSLEAWASMGVGNDSLFLTVASLIPPPARVERGEYSVPVIGRSLAHELPDGSLDLGACQVFDLESGKWYYFFDSRFTAYAGVEPHSRRVGEAIARFYAKQFKPVIEKLPHEDQRFERPEPEPEAAPAATLNALAERVSAVFNLPRGSQRLALNILLGLAPNSTHKLPPYQAN